MEYSKCTDAHTRYDKEALTKAIRIGDEDGYVRQAALVVSKVLNRLRWSNRTSPHRDEIEQECLIECLAWFRAGNLDPDQNVSAYLWRSIGRKAISLLRECGESCEIYDESIIEDSEAVRSDSEVQLTDHLKASVERFGHLFGDNLMTQRAGWVADLLTVADYALVNPVMLSLQYSGQYGADLPPLTVDRILYAISDMQRKVGSAYAEPEQRVILNREAVQ